MEKESVEEFYDDIDESFSELVSSKTFLHIYAIENDIAIEYSSKDFVYFLNSLSKPYRDKDVNFSKYIKELKVYNCDFDGETHNTYVFEMSKFIDTWYSNITFVNCTFNYCDFVDCGFSNVLFLNCDFNHCKFIRSKFKTISFDNCNFDQVSMIEIDLLRVQFPESKIGDIHFHHCSHKSFK